MHHQKYANKHNDYHCYDTGVQLGSHDQDNHRLDPHKFRSLCKQGVKD